MKKSIMSLMIGIGVAFLSITSTAQGKWVQDSAGWKYYSDENTVPANSWQLIFDTNGKGQWYYFDENAYMVHDRWIGEYYVGSDGVMLTGTVTPDGYFVDSSGKWLPWLKDGTYVSIKGMNKYVYTIAGACSSSVSINGIPLSRTTDNSTSYSTTGNGYTYTVLPLSDQAFVFCVTKLSTFGMTFYDFHLQQ